MRIKLISLFIIMTTSLAFANAGFRSEPKAIKTRAGIKINFSVTAITDVDVAIIDASGKVIRHLAAGMLGKNPPPPLKPNSPSQSILWDGKDDAGKIVTSKCSARVRLGMTSNVERYIGWNGLTLENEICGLTVGANGDIFIMTTEKTWGRAGLIVLTKDLKYKNTIIPYAADTPKERLKDFGQFTVNGKVIPNVLNAQVGSVQPLTSAFRTQDMIMHPDGHILAHSASGSLANHGPAQYILAIHSEGGAPVKTGYIGPLVRQMYGFMGGAGNSNAFPFMGLAISHDGVWMYECNYTDSYIYKKTRGHAVFRMKWDNENRGEPFIGQMEAGSDDQHLNNPLGLATDKKGNIYVCDYGNNRLMVYNAKAELISKTEIPTPIQVKVHPKTGEVYVMSAVKGNPCKDNHNSFIAKYSPLTKGPLKELYRIKGEAARRFLLFTIDHTSTPTRLLAVKHHAWRAPNRLFVITDNGKALEEGERIGNEDGLQYPLFVSADMERERLYVRTFINRDRIIDLNTAASKKWNIDSRTEIVVGPKGDLFVAQTWAWHINRYTPELKRIMMSKGNEKGRIGPIDLGVHEKWGKTQARAKGFGQGGRGYCFGPDGNMYIIMMPQYSAGRVDVYSPDGELIKENLIENLPYSSGGIAIDQNKNIYLGVNLRPLEGTDFYPKGFEQAPTEKWTWYKTKRNPPWNNAYFNTYLFHYGKIIKFPAKGGKFYSWRADKPETKPKDTPANLTVYRSGYLSENIVVEGEEWLHNGCSPLPTSGELWGDPSCSCWNVRLGSDKFNRIFVPNAFNFSIDVVDSAGNQITSIGHYDNCDNKTVSDGSSKNVDAALAWACYVDVEGDTLFVSDSNNNRVAMIKTVFAVTKSCTIK